jgi:pantoate--beta-alanine ligase
MNPVVHSVSELRHKLVPARQTKVIGLVPTMGALHAGHAKLIEIARAECAIVVVSIFVNPLQFGPAEDYSRYPRTLTADLEVCSKHEVDLVFAPSVEDIYPQPQVTFVDVTRVSEHLCGAFRPGHFRGVATVVAKLFNIVQPDRAYFGQKDLQQLAVVRRLVADLNMAITIVGVPTVREPDGLALSSRNRYLTIDQRRIAITLYRALQHAQELIRGGERDASKVREAATAVLKKEPEIRMEYFEIVDPDKMQPITGIIAGPVCAAGAIWLGNTRLIDNVLID